jgi:cardiolipin synthase
VGRAWIPNALTISRLLLAFAFPFLPPDAVVPAVVWGLGTELLDGWLARRMGIVSRFGALLDPVADKAFVASVLLTLLRAGRTTWPDLLLVGLRDVVLGGASLGLLARRDLVRHVAARPLGKATTALQMGFLLWVVAAGDAPRILVGGAAAMGGAAVVDQALAWRRALGGATAPDRGRGGGGGD